MSELKPCPFCGGGAEMYTGRTFPTFHKHLCKTEEDALAYLEECKSSGVVVDYKISTHARRVYHARINGYTGEKTYLSVSVELQAYIPRCLNQKCLGRTTMMFRSETEATEAWNRRYPNENPKSDL